MKILRNLVYIVVIVGGIVLASANMQPVHFVYIPDLPFLAQEQPAAAADVPLALLLLAFLLAGAVVAGTGTFVEQMRLRFLVRRNAKVVKGLRTDLEKTKAALEAAEAQIVARTAEVTAEQAKARRAEEAEAKAKADAEQARAEIEQERQHLAALRADEATAGLLPPADA
jgi:uncharacterized membrane protein YciS (DUF1049 family)